MANDNVTYIPGRIKSAAKNDPYIAGIEDIEGGIPNKEYDPEHNSGLGRKTLQLKGDSNVLTQDDFDQENTIYVINYDFDLNGATVEIPEGCTLLFEGGSISNGTIVGNDTVIGNPFISTRILNNVVKDGVWKDNIMQNGSGIVYPQNTGRVLAHRGYPHSRSNRFCQDNSLASIVDAAIYGFTGIECDPRRDKNGVIVLLHDWDVRSVSNYKDPNEPAEPTEEQLHEMYDIANLDYRDIFYKDRYGFSTNKHLTTLSDAVSVCKAYNLFMLFDYKLAGVSVNDLVSFMKFVNYQNYGLMGYDVPDLASAPDYVIKIFEQRNTIERLMFTVNQFSCKQNLYMRKYNTGENGVSIEVLEKCKELGIKIAVNYDVNMGEEIDEDRESEYIENAYKYYDLFLGDFPILSNQRHSDVEIEGGVIKCIDGRLPIYRSLQSNNDPSTMTYKEALWQLNSHSDSDPRLVTGYVPANLVETKIPDLSEEFPYGSIVVSSMFAPYRFLNMYISGGVDLPKFLVENIYNDSSRESEHISRYELVHNLNFSSFLNKELEGLGLIDAFLSTNNNIAHSADVPAIGTNYTSGEWRAVGESEYQSVIPVSIPSVPRLKKGVRINNTSDGDIGIAYEISDFKPGIYTFSAYVKGSGVLKIGTTNGDESYYKKMTEGEFAEYTRVSCSISIPKSALYNQSRLIFHLISNAGSNFDICGFMLQESPIPTDWAPKDTDYPNSGITENRPTNIGAGFQYFDTTLGKPVFYTGSIWVDATGTPA